MRSRIRERFNLQDGFTLIELLIVILLIGILASIALAVFLRQQDKGKDVTVKSNVNNLARLVESCNAGQNAASNFNNCDTAAELGRTGLPLTNQAPVTTTCAAPTNLNLTPATIAAGSVRVFRAMPACFVALGHSNGNNGGNYFWYIRTPTGAITRGCMNPNLPAGPPNNRTGEAGCPAPFGAWAG